MVKPKVEYLKAYNAMKVLGIPREIVRPVLKDLLNLYNNNWQFIEAEDYQALADAIFQSQEEMDAEIEQRSPLECESSEPHLKRLNVVALDDDYGKLPSLTTGTADSCLAKFRGSGTESGLHFPETHFINERNANISSVIVDFIPGHTDSVEDPSTGNETVQSLASQCMDNEINVTGLEINCCHGNGKRKFTTDPSTMAEVKLSSNVQEEVSGSSLELVSNFASRHLARELSAEVISKNDRDSNVRPLKNCLRSKNSVNVSNAKEVRYPTRLRLRHGRMLPISPDKQQLHLDSSHVGKGKEEVNISRKEEDNDNDFCLGGIEKQANGLYKKSHLVDVAKGKEKVKISVVDENGNGDLPNFFYIPKNLAYQNAYVNVSLARISDEDCCTSCSGDCLSSPIPCACSCETGGEFAYTSEGLLKEEFLTACLSIDEEPEEHFVYCKDCPIERSRNGKMSKPCKGHLMRKFIKECWSKCGCSLQCGNRVVQQGITRSLQVFWTREGKGWGLRVAEDLPKGAFVCEYVGEILTNTELYERNLQRTGSERHIYPVLLDADWVSESILKDEEALCLDATFYGNVARFINHRCNDANLLEIPVQVETPDRHYYHLAFFTKRKVKAFEELTWGWSKQRRRQ
ncbi:hypothetical protein Ancab_031942 [Ancistrocladus abbreviatus]